MKRMLPAFLRNLLLSALLIITGFTARASHIVGAELTYKWITCNTYQITLVFYGNCGSASASAFSSLPTTIPTYCVYDGTTLVDGSRQLHIIAPSAGVEVTPVCSDSLAYDACSVPTSTTPGIKKFIYRDTFTFPHNSDKWRLIYNGNTVSGSPPGRAADITNLSGAGGTTLALIDTLNNSYTNTRGHNSSPVLTVEPVPFFCPNNESCYNPGAVDVYDTNPADEPSGDSLNFLLITPENSSGGCALPGLCTYAPIPFCPSGALLSGSRPVQVVDCTPASFSFDATTGQLCFNPIGPQRSVVVYNVQEYRNDTVTNIHTIAGGPVGGFSGDFGPALAAFLDNPAGVRTDKLGNIYFADQLNNRVRKIASGIISTVAGNGFVGYCGDGAQGTAAHIYAPTGVGVDTSGNVIFADKNNNVVRRVNAVTGVITTVAGNGFAGFVGDGQAAVGTITTIAGSGAAGYSGSPSPALSATMTNPAGIAKDIFGNTYFCDYTNNRIRKINASLSFVTTIAGGATAGYTGDGGDATLALLNNPEGMYISGDFLYFADYGNHAIRKIQLSTNIISTIAGTGVAGYSGDFGPATDAKLNHPHSVFVDASGVVYLTDGGNNMIRKIDGIGTISSVTRNGLPGFAGDGSSALAAGVKLNDPYGIWVDPLNRVFFTDAGNNRIRYINTTGQINTLAGGSGVPSFSGDGGPASAARFNNPRGIVLNNVGDILVADYGNSRIRKIEACDSVITTVAGRGISGYSGDGFAPDSAKLNNPSFVYWESASAGGGLYISDNNNNRIRRISVCELNHPTGVFVDKHNNIYISDAGNQVIRKVTPDGVINTIIGTPFTPGYAGNGGPAVLARINNPGGLFANDAGDVYFADVNNNLIRKVVAGIISNAAGDTVLAGFHGDNCIGNLVDSIRLNHPNDVSVDDAGNMYIADAGNNRIRKVDANNIIETVAGTGAAGFGGDFFTAELAVLNSPAFLCLDPQKNILVSDFNNNRIRQVDHNTTVNRILVGTMQREMTFKVLPACAYFAPTGGIDSTTGSPVTTTDTTHIAACQYSGTFVLHMNPTEADTAYHITVTASGLNTGFSFVIDSDNTNHPHATVTGNTSVIAPGIYTFYLTYTDNHCPLVGTQTQPFTVQIYPVPTIRDSLISAATCSDQAAYMIIPGGYGSPWTVKVSTRVFPYDTIRIFSSDTSAFIDSLKPYPGPADSFIYTIYTSVSNQCSRSDTIVPAIPGSTISATYIAPTYCGAHDYADGGRIIIHDLPPGLQDTLSYSFYHVPILRTPFISSSAGTDTIYSLYSGQYDSIIIQQYNCFDTLKGVSGLPDTLIIDTPTFTFRTVTGSSPTGCKYCNGTDTLFGMHPGQVDTMTYRYNSSAGITRFSRSSLIGPDSFFVFPGLCEGIYDSFTVQTGGGCVYTLPGAAITLQSPPINAAFDFTVHYGCNGDTLMFNNLSTSAPGDALFYHWDFGDGATDNTLNPMHIYPNTVNDTVRPLLQITNLHCDTSYTASTILNNYIHADFTADPSQFICQLSPVTLTNTSVGINPTYTWYYGDGTTENTVSPVHIFTNSGTYTIMLVAADNLIPTPTYFTPCYDTAIHVIAVDSTSAISINATDSVICTGQAITFTGIYAHIGDTGNIWKFGDGGSRINTNPVIHSYDGQQTYTISVTALYRSCAAQTSSRTIRVYDRPSLYLGPDTAICPGGMAILLLDNTNQNNKKATWSWNTGDSSAGISVTKPGYYSAMVTINGCSAYDTVWVQKDCYMDIPNAFSPNNDGNNDYFYPRQLLTKGLVTFKMDIYNRWGQMVYETTNTDGRGWDGSFNGTQQPEGVYIYLIEATFKDGQVEHHQGNVTLLR